MDSRRTKATYDRISRVYDVMEMVSEPDLRSPEEAVAYLKKIRTLMICCQPG